jgi:hypothetical protein
MPVAPVEAQAEMLAPFLLPKPGRPLRPLSCAPLSAILASPPMTSGPYAFIGRASLPDRSSGQEARFINEGS